MPARKIRRKNIKKPRLKPAKPSSKKLIKRATKKSANSKKKLATKTPLSVLLMIFFVSIVLVILWTLLHTNAETDRINKQIIKSADSMLFYDANDIKTASIVGTIKQLKSEIVGWSKGNGDLHQYMIRDYKQYKKACIVNGMLAGDVYYELVNMTYNSYALIKKGCNGTESYVLKKFKTGWAVIYSGNELISCKLVNDFDIPQSISYNCVNNGVVYVNPNP